jgi:hypothetical protein
MAADLQTVADKLYLVTLYTPTLKDTKTNLDALGKVKLTDLANSAGDAAININALKAAADTSMDAISKKIAETMKAASKDVKDKSTEMSTTLSTKLSAMATSVTNTFTSIGSTIADKLKSASSDVTAKFGEMATTISSKMTAITTKVSNEVSSWVNLIKEAIKSVKAQFGNGFDWGVPELKIPTKLPKYKVEGKWEFDTEGNIKKTPKISVEWYRRAAEMGALFTEPSIIGVGDAAQPEMLIGEDTLYNSIRKAVMDSNGGGFNQTNNFTMAEGYSPIEAARLIRNNTRQVLTRMRGGV